jgi:hypothetical protein
LWQSIFIKDADKISGPVEDAALKTCFNVVNKAKTMAVPVDIVSHSFDSIVYKGMIRPRQIADFYLDLKGMNYQLSFPQICTHATLSPIQIRILPLQQLPRMPDSVITKLLMQFL